MICSLTVGGTTDTCIRSPLSICICLSEGVTLNTEIDETETVYDLPE